jgi:hypothetical protein
MDNLLLTIPSPNDCLEIYYNWNTNLLTGSQKA